MKRKLARRWGGEGNSTCETQGRNWLSVLCVQSASGLEKTQEGFGHEAGKFRRGLWVGCEDFRFCSE